MKFYIFLSLLLMCQLAAVAGDLHDIFPTDDGKLFIYSSKESHLDPKKIAAAAKDRESLPALKFPEGNWGDAINGCQLSLRFEKSRYASNERINAIILIRNTTNYIISFMENDMIVRDGFDLFQITTSTGEVFSPELPKGEYITGGGKIGVVYPGTQNRHVVSLSDRYIFTNGTYLITATVKIQPMSIKTADGNQLASPLPGPFSVAPPVTMEPPDAKSAAFQIRVHTAEVPIQISGGSNK